VVNVSRKIGRASLYKINPEHPMVTMFRDYEKKLSIQIAEKEEEKQAIPAT